MEGIDWSTVQFSAELAPFRLCVFCNLALEAHECPVCGADTVVN